MTKLNRAALACAVSAPAILLAMSGATATVPASQGWALEGKVSSAQEGAMEGVVVSAKRTGATITVSVISDESGHYHFPADRLAPGHYALAIRAVGYDLQGSDKIDVGAGKVTRDDLTLAPTKDLASQLSSAEWILSAPGTEQQKSSLMNCAECHTLQLPMMSAHNSEEFQALVQRMLGAYAYQSQPGDAQFMPRPRHLDPARVKEMGDYLASVNLGAASHYPYPLKTLPRVKGAGTHVIITEYDLPRPMAQPHDVIVDPSGTVWYDDFGKEILGRLDSTTGKTQEYPIPLIRPDRPVGSLAIENGLDGKIWVAMHLQAAVGLFDPKTKKFRVYPVPDSMLQPNTQTSQISPSHEAVDGRIWTEAAADAATRIDVKTGKYEYFYPFADLAKSGMLSKKAEAAMPVAGLGGGEGAGTESKARGSASSMGVAAANVMYGVASDSKNNFYGMSFLGRSIIRVDANGKPAIWDTATPFSQPRRGQMDAQDRLWFAQYNANRIAMLDTKTDKITDYPMKTPWTAPYDAILDKNGFAWTGGMNTDRVARVNSTTGEVVEYQLPKTTNIRRVFVDNRPAKPVFWVGSNHGASVIKVEPLD